MTLLLLIGLACFSSVANAASLTPMEQKSLVDLHNQARCEVQPAASKMAALEWDSDLAEIAQNWVDSCPTSLNRDRTSLYPAGTYVGENLAYGREPQDAVRMWLNQASHFDLASGKCNTVACGYYTQVVWAESTRIGCATPSHDRCQLKILDCYYATGGNQLGKKPYEAATSAVTTAACRASGIVPPVAPPVPAASDSDLTPAESAGLTIGIITALAAAALITLVLIRRRKLRFKAAKIHVQPQSVEREMTTVANPV
jgi:hypothetical protein